MTTARILEAAADKIERDGWRRGDLGDSCGRVCARGAIYTAMTGVYDPPHEVRVHWRMALGDDHPVCVVDRWAEREGWKNGAMQYNDAPGRTKEEVIAMLRAVAATERARESLRDASLEALSQNTAVSLELPVTVSA